MVYGRGGVRMMSGLTWSIWDLDGCLSDDRARLPLQLDGWLAYHQHCGDDPIREAEVSLLRAWRQAVPNRRVAIFTARPEWTQGATELWLKENGLSAHIDLLYMRPEMDDRSSEIVKQEMVVRLLRANPGGGKILFAVEDTPALVCMYRALGISVLQSISLNRAVEGEESSDVSTSES